MKHRKAAYFWEKWPIASQQRFHKMVLFGALVVTFSSLIGFKLFAGTVEQQITEAKEQYGRVVPIVQEVLSLQAQQGDLAHLAEEKAVWNIIDDLQIEEQLISIRPTKVDQLTEGVQVTFEGLSLTKLTEFLRVIRDRASLQTPDCTITRNSNDPRLADAHFVLAR